MLARILLLAATLGAAGCGASQHLVSVGPDPAMRGNARRTVRPAQFASPRPTPDQGFEALAIPIPTMFGRSATMPANPFP